MNHPLRRTVSRSGTRVRLVSCVLFAFLVPALAVAADEPIFSGPQPAEKLPAFQVRGVFDADAGQEIDFVTRAAGQPLVLVFVHDVNRQSISMTRVLSAYTASRAQEGLHTGVVWLQDDATEAESTLKRIRHALAPGAPTGISLDGREGPGSYGLNRNVTLTILVGKEGRVTANFALVQPSLQADLPKILEAIAKVAGGRVPKVEELLGEGERTRMAATEPDPNLRGLLRPVIQLNASADDVDKAAQAVEEYVAKNVAAQREVGRIAQTIINAGKLADYGTPRAQEYLRKWRQEYGGAAPSKPAPGKPAPGKPAPGKPAPGKETPDKPESDAKPGESPR